MRDLGMSCHIKNNDTGMYDIIEIDEPVAQVILMELHLKVKQIGLKLITLYSMLNTVRKGRENLFSLTCNLSQGVKMSSDDMKNIVLDTIDDCLY